MSPLSPTLILYNGNLYTQWPEVPHATAIAFLGGRIAAVGDDETIRALAGRGTRQVDLQGRFAMPGLTDAHVHLWDWAIARDQVHLAGARGLEEMKERIRAKLEGIPPGQWVIGQGWNETEWTPSVMPASSDLDTLSTNHPMAFWRSDLHGAVANSLALRAAGITRETPDPEGGVIERDEQGEPTGRLFELAIGLLRDRVPPPPDEVVDEALRATIRECHGFGLTGLHDQRMKGHGEGGPALRAYRRLHAAGELRLRLTTNVDAMARAQAFAIGMTSGFGDERLQLGHLKVFVDGSLGSQTAWMLQPFEGTRDNFGVVVTAPEEIRTIVEEAQDHGWAVSVHAIGDRANREVLDIFEELAPQRKPSTRLPHRIEHVQTLQPEDLPRLGHLGLVASVQPIHQADDWVAIERLWGERGRNSYRFRSLLDTGAILAFGSDVPVASPNPFHGLYAAIERKRVDGQPEEGWYPEERLSLEEALLAYTIGPAKVVGRDHEQGRLAPGFFADLIVLDRDLFAVPPEAIPHTVVEMVVFDGEVQER